MKPSTHTTVRLKSIPISFVIEKRAIVVLSILTLSLIALSFVSLSSGTTPISFGRVLATLMGSGNTIENFSVLTLRLPRVLMGILVGVALSLSGAILQGLIRNPLAAPDVIGVNSGASLMAVLFIAFFGDRISVHYLPLFSFLGGIVVVFIMYGLSWKGGVSPLRLILIGFGVRSLLGAIQTLFMIYGPIMRTSQAYRWLTGSLHATKWYEVHIVFWWMLILVPLVFFAVKALNMQQVSDDITISLGGSLQLIRLSLIALSACLAGIAIAFSGGIGFVGLMSPHIARKLVGTTYGQLLPTAGLVGAILVVLADWIGRTWFAPLDIAAGVFTAMLGGIFFIYLFIRTANK